MQYCLNKRLFVDNDAGPFSLMLSLHKGSYGVCVCVCVCVKVYNDMSTPRRSCTSYCLYVYMHSKQCWVVL